MRTLLLEALHVVQQVVVAVAPNPRKAPLFDLKERVELAKIATQGLPGVVVEPFDGLLVEYVRRNEVPKRSFGACERCLILNMNSKWRC